MVDDKYELKVSTVWRKYLKYLKDGESFFDNAKFAAVFCVREVTGYAVWYRRYLDESDQESHVENLDGSYLLRFYTPDARHEAIEFAVQATKPGADPDVAVAHLDTLAKSAARVWGPSEQRGPFETIT